MSPSPSLRTYANLIAISRLFFRATRHPNTDAKKEKRKRRFLLSDFTKRLSLLPEMRYPYNWTALASQSR